MHHHTWLTVSLSLYMWGSQPWESFLRYHTPFLWDRVSHWFGTHQGAWTGWLGSPRDPPISISPALRFQVCTALPDFLKTCPGNWTPIFLHVMQTEPSPNPCSIAAFVITFVISLWGFLITDLWWIKSVDQRPSCWKISLSCCDI